MSTGGKCVKTCVPSMPSQRKVECGMTLESFQLIFWVRNHFAPADAMICGSAPE